MSGANIESKFREMVDSFRSEFEKLSAGEKQREQPISSLRQPCQFWLITSPEKSHHMIIVTRLSHIPDKSVFIHNLSEAYVDELNSMSKTLYSEGNNIAPDLEQFFVSFGKSIVREDPKRTQTGINSMTLVNENCAVWHGYGRIESMNLKVKALEIVNGYKVDFIQTEKEKTKPEKVRQTVQDEITGCCTFCFPALIVGQYSPSVKDRILEKEQELLTENVLVQQFDQHTLVINKAGLIGLQTQNVPLALEIFNTIMGSGLCLGVPLYAVRASEIASTTFNKNTQQATGFSYSQSSIRMMQFGIRHSPDWMHLYYLRTHILEDDLQLIIKTAEEIWKSKEKRNYVRQLLNSFTHLRNEEFSQSFLMSWTAIERYVYNLWDKKLQSSGAPKKIRAKLENWESARIIEILHLDGIISDDDYPKINLYRNLRNDIIHEGYDVTKKQAEECYQFANEVTKNEIGISAIINTRMLYGT